jgi:hypothetical protein
MPASAVFNASDSFTPPSTGLYLVQCYGAGGNGASSLVKGGGGGGGGYSAANVFLQAGATVPVTVDSGGNQGSTSCVGVSAASGYNAATTNGAAGGNGTMASGTAGTNASSILAAGGAGGAAAGPAAGAGGAGATGTGSAATAGSSPGGGGGGCCGSYPAGGAGGNGQVIITFTTGVYAMFSLSTSQSTVGPGYTFSAQVTDSGGGCEPHAAPIPAATAGTMASSTTFTVPTGSIANGAIIAIFWYLAGVLKGALNLTVTGVAAGNPNDTVTVSVTGVAYVGGASALPSSGAITAAVAYPVEATFAMSTLVGLGVTCDQVAATQFFSSSASLYVDVRNPAPSEFRYSTVRGDALPFSGTVASINVYNSATVIANWQLGVITQT